MWPMMAVMTLTPRPHSVSFTRTGAEYLAKSRQMAPPGRRMAEGSSGTWRLHRAQANVMRNSTIREASVATAAPVMPRAGAPHFPKIRM